MGSLEQTRRVERRFPAAQRKYGLALKKFLDGSTFTHEQTFFEFKPKKNSVECTTYFRLYGDPKKYRFDYEINLLMPLPRVDDIRNLIWRSFVDYGKMLPSILRGATDAMS